MEAVYVVVGRTGEYSDRHEWFVAAYADEKDAQQHAEAAKIWLMQNPVPKGEWALEWYEDNNQNPFDPKMSVDYTGTDWTVKCVPFRTTLPPRTAS